MQAITVNPATLGRFKFALNDGREIWLTQIIQWQTYGGLRSRGKVDVAAMAEKFGGGGHRNAAGFRMPLERFVAEILKRSW